MKSSDGELDASDVNDMEKAHSLLSEVRTRHTYPVGPVRPHLCIPTAPPPAARRPPPTSEQAAGCAPYPGTDPAGTRPSFRTR